MILQTVSKVTTSDGRGASSTVDYIYEGGAWSNIDRRFLGFRKVTATLDAQGNFTETYYIQKDGSISKPEAIYYKDNNGKIFRHSKFEYDDNSVQPYTSLLKKRWEYEYDVTEAIQNPADAYVTLLEFAYDVYGNVETAWEWGEMERDAAGNVLYQDNCDPQDANCTYKVTGDERTTIRGYVANVNNGNYLTGLPAYENVYKGFHRPENANGGDLIKQTFYYYDGNSGYTVAPSTGNVTKVEKWNSDPAAAYSSVAATMTYDAYGNMTSRTDERGNTSTIQYDPVYHLYPERQCNVLNQCKMTTWDTVMGLKTFETDDANMSAQTGHAEYVTQYSYLDWGNPNAQHIRKVEADGVLWSEVYQDGLGREYKKVKRGDPSQGANPDISQETVFSGTSNRVDSQTFWHRGAEEIHSVTYQYDGLGRQVRANNPDGTFSRIVYALDAERRPYIAYYDQLDHEKVVWKNAYGNLLQVREKNGAEYFTTSYEYDMAGNLVRVMDQKFTYDSNGNIVLVNNQPGNTTQATYDSLGRKLTTIDPDMGTWSYTYDPAGNLLTQTDAKGKTTGFAYDAINRLTNKTSPDGNHTSYYYDESGHGAGTGRLTRVVYPEGSESYTYDATGLKTAVETCVDTTCYTVGQSYDALGRVAAITYPENDVVDYSYDAEGNLKSVGDYVDDMRWKTSGQLKRIENSNQTAAEFTYDPYRLWMNTATVTGPGNSTLYQASYGYDEAGRVTAMASPTLQYNLAFTYDDLNRLKTITGAQEQTYNYDPVGGIAHNSLLGAYSYNDPAHPHAVTNAAGETYQYDANGNMLSGNGRTLLWDDQNRLQSVTRGGATTTFAYNDRGNRIRKTGSNGTVDYFSGLIEVVNGALVKYVYAGPMLVAKKEASGGKYWYHSDHLGSVRLITNESGSQNPNVITENKYQYAAFGETISQSGALANEKGFTGHTTDPETGLIYMGARYYDANLGRFISADTIVPEPSNPQAFNRYSYCMNNPISNTDPTGHAAFAVPLFSAVLVAASEAASTYVIATAFIGAGLSIAGYCMRNPLLSTLGAVMLGFAGGCVMPGAGGMAGGLLGASVAGATSPISPLDSGVKEAIGWAYMAYGMIRCISAANSAKAADDVALSQKQVGQDPVEMNYKFDPDQLDGGQCILADENDLINDPVVRSNMENAWNESNPGTALAVEQGGCASPTGSTRFPAGSRNHIDLSQCPPGSISYHTHPNIGSGWREPPSWKDINNVLGNWKLLNYRLCMFSYCLKGGAAHEDIDFGSEWSVHRSGGLDFAFS